VVRESEVSNGTYSALQRRVKVLLCPLAYAIFAPKAVHRVHGKEGGWGFVCLVSIRDLRTGTIHSDVHQEQDALQRQQVQANMGYHGQADAHQQPVALQYPRSKVLPST